MSENKKPSPEARKQRALRRLGTDAPRCGTCGEDNPHCLEKHHVAGQKNDPDAYVLICRNCHRKLSDQQRDHPGDNPAPEATLEKIAHFMLGLADMLALIVEKLREFAAKLFAHEKFEEVEFDTDQS